jgi:hypothetical protein
LSTFKNDTLVVVFGDSGLRSLRHLREQTWKWTRLGNR